MQLEDPLTILKFRNKQLFGSCKGWVDVVKGPDANNDTEHFPQLMNYYSELN